MSASEETPIASSNPAPVKKGPIMLALVVALAVIIILVVASSSPSSKSPSTSSTLPVTTTTSREIVPLAKTAATASVSVVRGAVYSTRTASAHVNAFNIMTAAKPDKGTLVILNNLGTIPGYPNVVAFSWKLGLSPIINCVKVPATRADFPKTLKEEARLIVACPSGVRAGPTTPTTMKVKH